MHICNLLHEIYHDNDIKDSSLFFKLLYLKFLTDQILVDISNKNTETILNIMTDFEHIEKVLRRLKGKKLSMDFQRYRSVLLYLEKSFEEMKSNFSSQIQTLLPRMRSKKAKENELTKLLQDYNSNPYEKERFLALLSTRQKEIETAEFIIYHETLAGKKVCYSQYVKWS